MITYNSILSLISTLSHYVRFYTSSMRSEEFLIKHKFAKNKEESNYIRGLIRNYLMEKCTLNRVALNIIYIHYKHEDICFENVKGDKMKLSRIVKTYVCMPPGKKIIKTRDAVRALEKFLCEYE